MQKTFRNEPPPHSTCSLCLWVISLLIYCTLAICVVIAVWFLFNVAHIAAMESETEKAQRKNYDEICIPYPGPQSAHHTYCLSLGAMIERYNKVDLVTRALLKYFEHFGICGSVGCLAYVGQQYQSLKHELLIAVVCLCVLLLFVAYFFKQYAGYLRAKNSNATWLPTVPNYPQYQPVLLQDGAVPYDQQPLITISDVSSDYSALRLSQKKRE